MLKNLNKFQSVQLKLPILDSKQEGQQVDEKNKKNNEREEEREENYLVHVLGFIEFNSIKQISWLHDSHSLQDLELFLQFVVPSMNKETHFKVLCDILHLFEGKCSVPIHFLHQIELVSMFWKLKAEHKSGSSLKRRSK